MIFETSKPLLSICIPTYNRSQYLTKTIDSIVSQKEFLSNEVEIVICDNASTDETDEIVKPYVESYKNFIYVKNDVNINNDNFPKVLSLGNGVLRKLSNDTLCYKPDALSQMCEIIREYKNQRPYISWTNGCIKNKKDISEGDFEKYVNDVSFMMTSIGCFSAWEEDCSGIEKDTAGAELLLWQVRKSLELAQKKNSVVIVNSIISQTQPVQNKNVSYGLYQVFYINYFKLLSPYFEKNILNEDTRAHLEKDLLYNFFTEWCIDWELNKSSKNNYSEEENLKEVVFKEYQNKPYWNEYIKKYNRTKLIKQIINFMRR